MSARQSINKDKSTTRTSAVDDASKTIVNTLKQNLKEIRSQMRDQRSAISLVTLTQLLPKLEERRKKLTDKIAKLQQEASGLTSEIHLKENVRIAAWYLGKVLKLDKSKTAALEKIEKLQDGATPINTEKATDLIVLSEQQRNIANQEVKELRKTLYWGTYLLIEDAVKQAAKMSPEYLAPKTKPIHQLPGRIGVQIMGGLSANELTDDTRMQLLENDHAKSTFRLRVGTVENSRQPIWADFPAKLHRPLPKITNHVGHRLAPPRTPHVSFDLSSLPHGPDLHRQRAKKSHRQERHLLHQFRMAPGHG